MLQLRAWIRLFRRDILPLLAGIIPISYSGVSPSSYSSWFFSQPRGAGEHPGGAERLPAVPQRPDPVDRGDHGPAGADEAWAGGGQPGAVGAAEPADGKLCPGSADAAVTLSLLLLKFFHL